MKRYSDTDAALVHLHNFSTHFVDCFPDCLEPTSILVYGRPTDEARAALNPYGAAYLDLLWEFDR